jgi:chromosome segregation ATPase
MSDPILDIEDSVGKIEALIKNLRDERDKAVKEAAGLRSALDDRELELLQCDEELQKTRRDCENRLDEARRDREDMENRLADVAARVKNILPIVSDYADSPADDRT